MKICIVLLLALIVAAALYLKFAGVTHEDLRDAVRGESATIQQAMDDRYRALDRKLDRIEGKLDRLLEIANRPLPDGMSPAAR